MRLPAQAILGSVPLWRGQRGFFGEALTRMCERPYPPILFSVILRAVMPKSRTSPGRKKKTPRRNPHAAALRASRLFAPKVVPDKSRYSRKSKHPKDPADDE
jgi:hypothetical protein